MISTTGYPPNEVSLCHISYVLIAIRWLRLCLGILVDRCSLIFYDVSFPTTAESPPLPGNQEYELSPAHADHLACPLARSRRHVDDSQMGMATRTSAAKTFLDLKLILSLGIVDLRTVYYHNRLDHGWRTGDQDHNHCSIGSSVSNSTSAPHFWSNRLAWSPAKHVHCDLILLDLCGDSQPAAGDSEDTWVAVLLRFKAASRHYPGVSNQHSGNVGVHDARGCGRRGLGRHKPAAENSQFCEQLIAPRGLGCCFYYLNVRGRFRPLEHLGNFLLGAAVLCGVGGDYRCLLVGCRFCANVGHFCEGGHRCRSIFADTGVDFPRSHDCPLVVTPDSWFPLET